MLEQIEKNPKPATIKSTINLTYLRKKKKRMTPGPKIVNFCSLMLMGNSVPSALLQPQEQYYILGLSLKLSYERIEFKLKMFAFECKAAY